MPSVLQMLPFACGFADPSVIDKGVSCRNTSAGSSGTGGCRKCTCQPWCALAASGDPLGAVACERDINSYQFPFGFSNEHLWFSQTWRETKGINVVHQHSQKNNLWFMAFSGWKPAILVANINQSPGPPEHDDSAEEGAYVQVPNPSSSMKKHWIHHHQSTYMNNGI